ncbi:MAG: DUF2934 domain-containing protein [Bryobacteraceae bacterium]
MAKKTKTENQQAASTETASTPAVTSAKNSAPVKAKTPAKATGAAKSAPVRSTSKKVAVVTPEPAIEVVAVLPPVAAAVTAADTLPVHDETELATQEVLDEREEIARIAYSYWVERRFAPGDPLHDWLRAEGEFRVRRYASV